MNIITIDGPSASGKGTVSHLVAQVLGWEVLDSGALYRISAYAVTTQGISPENEKAVVQIVSGLDICFKAGEVWVDGMPVSEQLRQETIANLASKMATYPALRSALLERQRNFIHGVAGLVADGRDMGTVVFPDAPLKIFLVADVKERANRRYQQLIHKGIPARYEDILADLQHRDDRDMHRAVAPLKPAADALVIDSSHMQIQEVVDSILTAWKSKADGVKY